MNKNNCELWIEDLRSKRYKQAKLLLRRTDEGKVVGYCCLGVACNTYKKATGNGKWNKRSEFMNELDVRIENSPVAEWLDLDKPFEDELMYLNDIGASFDRIADTIEQKLAKQ